MRYRIQKNKPLGFGKYQYLTGAQLAKSAEGTHYLQWAQQKGISIEPGLLSSAKESNEANQLNNQVKREMYEEASAHEKYHANRIGED